MIETLLLLCALAIIVPLLFITALFVNAYRAIQGKQPLTTEDAVSKVWEYIKINSNAVPFSQQKRHIQIPTKSKDILKKELKINENIKLVEKANEIHKNLIL